MFKVGDHVENVGASVPFYIRYGTILRVIPNEDMECLNEYEIDFGNRFTAKLYEPQIRMTEAEAGEV